MGAAALGVLIGEAIKAANEANQPPPGQWGEHRNEPVPPGNQLADAGISDAVNDPALTAWQNARQYGQPVTIEVDRRVPPAIRANTPKPGDQCWDLPGNVLGLPPGGKDGRTKGDLVRGLQDRGYDKQEVPAGQPLPPLSSLPDGTVVIMGSSHTAVVQGGRMVDFTKPSPTNKIPAKVSVRDSLDNLRNATGQRVTTPGGQPESYQPYKNMSMEIHTPPSRGTASRPASPPAGKWVK